MVSIPKSVELPGQITMIIQTITELTDWEGGKGFILSETEVSE